MKTKSQKILSVFMSMLIVFMYMTSASVQAVSQKMIFNFNKIEVSAGQDIQFDIVTLNPIAIKELNQAIINIPDGFTVTGMSETSPAFNGTVTYSVSGNYLNFSIASNGTLGNSDVIASIYMHVDENCTAKNYMFQWSTNAVSCILATGNSYTPQFNFGIITVGEGGNVQTTTTTTPAPTTTTTTTTTAKKYTYNVCFVDEETNQAVSGVRYNIVSYDYAHDPAQTVQTSGDTPQSFEFVSDTAYVALITIENALPDGYITADGATRWELSANNPDLTVYLRKPETTTTTTTTTTMTTSTTVSTYLNININSLPTKTAYTVGEELDLSGCTFSYEGMFSNGIGCGGKDINEKNEKFFDTSEFDSSKTGTYRIYIKVSVDFFDKTLLEETLYSENYFEVTVSEKTETFNSGDVNNDGFIDSVDASLVLSEYALLSTENGIGEFTPEQNTIADLNKDGEVNASDATLILMYYSYLSTDNQNSKDSIDIWLSYTLD